MSKLKLGPLEDETPVKLALELPAAIHRDLVAYAQAHPAQEGGKRRRASPLGGADARPVHGHRSGRSSGAASLGMASAVPEPQSRHSRVRRQRVKNAWSGVVDAAGSDRAGRRHSAEERSRRGAPWLCYRNDRPHAAFQNQPADDRPEGSPEMPRGDKSSYTDKQERKADHIAESYEDKGVSTQGKPSAGLGPPSTRMTAAARSPDAVEERPQVTPPPTRGARRAARPPGQRSAADRSASAKKGGRDTQAQRRAPRPLGCDLRSGQRRCGVRHLGPVRPS